MSARNKSDFSPEYRGIHMESYRSEEERKKKWKNHIMLYRPPKKDESWDDSVAYMNRLDQTVKVYEHSLEDFEFNSKKIIKHFKNYYGYTETGIYTIAQPIKFVVYKNQKEDFYLL